MKTITKKIGEHEFRIHRIPAFEAIELAGDLQRVFGPAIASLAAASVDKSQLGNVSVLSGILMDAAEALGRNLDGKMLRYMVEALIREDSVYIKLRGKGEFTPCSAALVGSQAELEDVLELAVIVLQHNFADFFAKAVARFGSGLTAYTPKANSQEEQVAERSPLDD